MPGETARQNGKLGGRPKLEATKLREALIRKAEEKAEILADALIEKALNTKKSGDVPALKEILDRGLGKAIQAVDVTTDGNPLTDSTIVDSKLDALRKEFEEKLRNSI